MTARRDEDTLLDTTALRATVRCLLGETRVDLLHLLEDLRDAYPGPVEETILTEVVANSLDSGATRISIETRPGDATLTVIDNGSGMKRRDLARYHNIASSTKARGEGIGFAGVGIKLGLLVARDVMTETRQKKVAAATSWSLNSRNRAPWKWIEPPGLVEHQGTAVRISLSNPLSPLLDPGFVRSVLARHFRPLLDPAFKPILSAHYPRGVELLVDSLPVLGEDLVPSERVPVEIRLPRKRKPSALGFLARYPMALPENRRGVAISTLGKVIRCGWDWLGVSPAEPDRVGGLIEVPALAACLTLNKSEFMTSGPHRATYLAFRKAIQETIQRQLAAWGDARESEDAAQRRLTRPLEKDLERVLVDLADDFPLLAALVEKRIGGQRRLPIGGSGGMSDGRGFVLASLAPATETVVLESPRDGHEAGENSPAGDNPEPASEPAPHQTQMPAPSGQRRPGRYGLLIRPESRPHDPELARLVESTVLVNSAHPAYRRAEASGSIGYHMALATAMSLAPLVVEPSASQAFVTAFLATWGEQLEPGKRRRRHR